jgi:hypothetical protein
MSVFIRRARCARTLAAFAFVTSLMLVSGRAPAQSFNVDIDQQGPSPQLGQGVPSSAFGAAAGQPGVWNSYLSTSTAASPLVNLAGAGTGATVQITATSTSPTTLGFNNPANSGDFALLLNDGAQIGTTVQGGSRTYTFSGLAPGAYSIFTYTARPQGTNGHLLIDIPGSNEGQLTATGTPTGNTFTPGVTHVTHTLSLSGSSFNINLTDVPGDPAGYVDGFQITLIPEPGTVAFLMAPLVLLRPRRRWYN